MLATINYLTQVDLQTYVCVCMILFLSVCMWVCLSFCICIYSYVCQSPYVNIYVYICYYVFISYAVYVSVLPCEYMFRIDIETHQHKDLQIYIHKIIKIDVKRLK